jgi:hypothetical protein
MALTSVRPRTSTRPLTPTRQRRVHIWPRDPNEHYVEPEWCSERLFAVEQFTGAILDPACGLGRITTSALAAGLGAIGSDIVAHGAYPPRDFYEFTERCDNIVTNPPFDDREAFTLHALKLARRKVATIFPVAGLNAAHWLRGAPLARVWLLTPRPSMPPASYLQAGGKPEGGRTDFCWLVFDHQGSARPVEMRWLDRNQ